jgi:ribosomal protein L11 methylase PrmA
LHIHLHERLASKTAGKELSQKNAFSEKKMLRVVDSLQSLTDSLHWKAKTTWENYYEEANRRFNYLEQKRKIIADYLDEVPGLKTAVDLGANEGEFSYLMSGKNIQTIAADLDSTAVNNLYKRIKKTDERNILPLVVDLTSPSPASGFNNKERLSLTDRMNADVALALALIHHLAIGKNVPFDKIASFFGELANYLIIEFIPKEDEKVKMILRQKKDIYTDYNEENFLNVFQKYFSTVRKETIRDSGRTIYLMKKRRN